MDKVQPVVLISIDGWGVSSNPHGNAVLNAKTPNMDRLAKEYLSTSIDASGNSVGLPDDVMGNSEVGHLTMGAGRICWQDLVRINKSLDEKTFFTNPVLVEALTKAKSGTGRVHFLGLLSDGGVHSHINHLFGFLQAAKQQGVANAFVHCFMDGRDTAPTSGIEYLKQLQANLDSNSYGKIATITGRYYAMDRDKRWDRIQNAYNAIVNGVGESSSKDKYSQVVQSRYNTGETDEFLTPIIADKDGCVQDGDVLIFINYRSDRMREIVESFISKKFHVERYAQDVSVYQMTQYDEKFPLPILYPLQTMTNGLTEWLSKQNLKQFHTAETEKYAHVTFFFAGGKEQQYPLETRFMVASPKVATYDLQPEMSMKEVGDSVIEAAASGEYAFILCNLAAPDMVGHTGVYDKTVIACEACDKVIGDIFDACQKYGYVLMVTSDHGNAEEMLTPEGNVKTSHSTNFVPLIIAADKSLNIQFSRTSGGMSDVAPTVLDIMGLPIPAEMTGKSMVKRA